MVLSDLELSAIYELANSLPDARTKREAVVPVPLTVWELHSSRRNPSPSLLGKALREEMTALQTEHLLNLPHWASAEGRSQPHAWG